MPDRSLPFRRSYLRAPTFARRAYDAVERLHAEEPVFPRPRDVKNLVEEVLPLALFVNSQERQQQRVRCKYFGGDHKFDAKIRIEGPQSPTRTHHVEVTAAVSSREHLAREALHRDGIVHAGPSVKRVKRADGSKAVESRSTARSPNAAFNDLVSWVVGAVRKKSNRSYPEGTILIVRADDSEAMLRPAEWYALAIAASKQLASSAPFESVFVVDPNHGHVLQIA